MPWQPETAVWHACTASRISEKTNATARQPYRRTESANDGSPVRSRKGRSAVSETTKCGVQILDAGVHYFKAVRVCSSCDVCL
jgi:hypothetical protein